MSQEKKKVLIIGSDSTVKGGITSVIDSFLNNEWKDIEVQLLPTYIEGNSMKKINFFIRSIYIYLKRLMKNDFDIAHVHMSYNGSFYRKLLIIKLSNLFKKKVILHLHGSEFEVFYNKSNNLIRKLIKNLFESCNCVIVLGDKWKQVIKKIAPKANIEVFNNAVKVPDYTVKWNKEKINILFLGVLIKRKGIYDLIEAIRILNSRNIVKEKNLNFIIGGTGKEENAIKELIKEHKLEHCVQMVGWVDGEKKENLLKKSQLFVLPSYNEGLPMAILEAMSYGIPIISTDVGSISEVVKDNETGFLIKPGEAESLAKAIIKVINLEEVWKVQSMTCKELIYAKFNEEEYFNEIKKLYNTLLK